jgi:hypothetical protein
MGCVLWVPLFIFFLFILYCCSPSIHTREVPCNKVMPFTKGIESIHDNSPQKTRILSLGTTNNTSGRKRDTNISLLK